MTTQRAPASTYRNREGLGVWEHRGKVAAVGIGHSPTSRRWDGTAENCIGALAIDALRKAIADAGVNPADVDGLVMDPGTTTGAHWEEGDPIPMDVVNAFNATDDPLDGIAKLSAEWILKNMPELSGINFTLYGPGCMSNAIVVAAQAVGDGMAHTCLVLKGWHNLSGRYYQGGAAAQETVAGNAWGQLWGTRAGTTDAFTFQEYLNKYNKTHDMMANFIVNSKKNGLMFPEGFFAQNRPEEITREDYINARWIVKPLNLFDMDIPIMGTAAYLFTTAERAQDMAQKPVYILNHVTTRPKFGLNQGLENAMLSTEATARKAFEGAGIQSSDLSFENMYDGFTVFHNHYLEGLRYGGMKRGEVLDFYESEDISISGPHPVSPSGGNCGSGRTRFWMHTDSIQQLQGRAGDRQISKPAEIGISGGPMPQGGDWTVWSSTPG